MKLTIKNSKSFPTQDGIAWSATLYIDGIKAAYAYDEGNGGEISVEWVNLDLEKKFGEYVDTLPLESGHKQDAGAAIAGLVDQHEADKKIKRWCKTQTVFQLKGDTFGHFRTVKSPFAPAVKKYLVDKYGDKLDTIYNETLI